MRPVFRAAFFVSLLLAVAVPSWAANVFIERFDDLTDGITFTLITNGVAGTPLITQGEDVATFFNFAATNAAVSLAANIFEPLPTGGPGALSDTFLVTAAAGATTISATFRSDTEGGVSLAPLTTPGVQTIVETGNFQSIGMITLSNGDTVDFQFRSDVETSAVPEPGSFLLLLPVAAALVVTRYRKHRRV